MLLKCIFYKLLIALVFYPLLLPAEVHEFETKEVKKIFYSLHSGSELKEHFIKINGMTRVVNMNQTTGEITLRMNDEFLNAGDDYSIYLYNSNYFKTQFINEEFRDNIKPNQDLFIELFIEPTDWLIEDNRNVVLTKLIKSKLFFKSGFSGEFVETIFNQNDYENININNHQLLNDQEILKIKMTIKLYYAFLKIKRYKDVLSLILIPSNAIDVSNRDLLIETLKDRFDNLMIKQYLVQNKPVRTFKIDNRIFAVVPTSMTVSDTLNNKVFIANMYILAVKNGSDDWKIMDLKPYIEKDVNFWSVFPEFPAKLWLPELPPVVLLD